MDKNNPDANEMKNGVTYLLCPDPKCNLFNEKDYFCACESVCPMQEKLIKIIRCFECNSLFDIVAKSTLSEPARHDCSNEKSAFTARIDNNYAIIYKRPS